MTLYQPASNRWELGVPAGRNAGSADVESRLQGSNHGKLVSDVDIQSF
jgi:hypothetical protein